MLRINRSVEYGLIAVDYLAGRDGEIARAREISESLDLPGGIVAKVLQRLAAAGIVVSEQGVHGGYRLARSLDDVSFLELSDAIDGHHAVSPCGDGSECDRRPYCSVAGPVKTLGTEITDLLSGITLGRLLDRSMGNRKGAAL